jgi:endonuclease/exonuclease/phosphatase family metal-dependent hydrolase
MQKCAKLLEWLIIWACAGLGVTAEAAGTFRVGTYNVENYLDEATQTRYAKSEESRSKVRQMIREMRADVLALQEIGSVKALEGLREGLRAEGCDFPYVAHVVGSDTNIQVGVLSKFPIIESREHTNDNFLLRGRRYRVGRGFAELRIQVGTNYTFWLITAHLKSKRAVVFADESEVRLEEAKILRQKVDAVLATEPEANLVVLGDFNDNRNSPPISVLVGRGAHKLIDTRPVERNGDGSVAGVAGASARGRDSVWTHYYAEAETYSRLDYILVSRGMAREWIPNETYIVATPFWGEASDHRPIVATFEIGDR